MKRLPQVLFAAAVAAAALAAQEAPPAPAPTDPDNAPPPAAPDASRVVLQPKAPAPAQAPSDDGMGRPVSAKIAADLAATMPKYSPPTPTPSVTAEPQDLREVDKPRNEIHRLPAYVVREERPPVFTQRDLYTARGIADLYIKSHPGLLVGNFFGLNSRVAYDMWLDEQRLEQMQDLAETAHAMALGGDKAESDYILKESQDTYLRPVIETWNGPGANGGFSGGGGR